MTAGTSRTATQAAAPAPGLSRLLRVVVAVDLLGLALMSTTALVFRGGSGPGWHWVVGLLALIVAGELTYVRLRHDDATEDLTLFEATVVINVLLLPAAQALVVPIVALAIASALRGRPPMKAVFNLGSYAAATAVLVGTFHLIATGNAFSARNVAALALGTAGFAVVNLVCLSRVLSVVDDVPARTVVREGAALSAFMAAGNVALGTVAVAVAQSAPALLPFTALPAVALTYAYRAAAQESDERSRSAQLLALSHVLAGRLDADEVLASFLQISVKAFRAEDACAVLDTGDGSWPTVIETRDGGVRTRSATPADVALLARTDGQHLAVHVDDPGVPGWRRALLAPIEAEGRRLGVVALGTRTKRGDLAARDAGLLTPLASALGVALRGAAHLERLVEETSKLKAVVDHSSDGILVLDERGRVLVWNPALAALTDVTAAHAIGRPVDDLVTTTDAAGQPLAPSAALAEAGSADARSVVELGLTRPDGEPRWVRCSRAAIHDDDGRLVRTVVIVHDVTRERQVERLKADFIATVSHELRTPVTPIKGYSDLLRRRGDQMTPEKRRECLDVISDRAAHLARLVEDLLLASRISEPSAPQHSVSPETDDLCRLARRALGDFAVDAVRVRLETPDDPVTVVCDPTRAIQVIGNLVSNALKYSPPDAPVTVAVTASDTHAAITVTDGGRGIAADQLDRIFDKFHRVEDPMTMTTGGTGLGLYIARQLAEAMRGSIAVHSTLGVGSTFTLTLPRTPAVPAPRSAPAYEPAKRTGEPAPA